MLFALVVAVPLMLGWAGSSADRGDAGWSGPQVEPIQVAQFPDCDGPVMDFGKAVYAGDELRVLTNALVLIPPCKDARRIAMTGTSVAGIGPVVSVTLLSDGVEETVWAGFISANEAMVVDIEKGAAALVSFTNDATSGAEDRNLVVSFVTP